MSMIIGEEYSTERLMKANEMQMKQILKKFKGQYLPVWKFGLIVSYNAAFMVVMFVYGKKLRGKRLEPAIPKNRGVLSLGNLFKKGVFHAGIITAIYLVGLTYITHNTISLQMLTKLSEIQSTYSSFGLKFDPNYQENLLFARMRKFGLSEQLIQEIKQELTQEKQKLINSGGLSAETAKLITEAEMQFKQRSQINKNHVENLV